MKIRALGDQLTFYDDEGNIIRQEPVIPPVEPDEERVLNIVDYEDMLMGIDPNAKPDFFIDVKNDEMFKDNWLPEDYEPKKPFDLDLFLSILYTVTAVIGTSIIGYAVSNLIWG